MPSTRLLFLACFSLAACQDFSLAPRPTTASTPPPQIASVAPGGAFAGQRVQLLGQALQVGDQPPDVRVAGIAARVLAPVADAGALADGTEVDFEMPSDLALGAATVVLSTAGGSAQSGVIYRGVGHLQGTSGAAISAQVTSTPHSLATGANQIVVGDRSLTRLLVLTPHSMSEVDGGGGSGGAQPDAGNLDAGAGPDAGAPLDASLLAPSGVFDSQLDSTWFSVSVPNPAPDSTHTATQYDADPTDVLIAPDGTLVVSFVAYPDKGLLVNFTPTCVTGIAVYQRCAQAGSAPAWTLVRLAWLPPVAGDGGVDSLRVGASITRLHQGAGHVLATVAGTGAGLAQFEDAFSGELCPTPSAPVTSAGIAYQESVPFKVQPPAAFDPASAVSPAGDTLAVAGPRYVDILGSDFKLPTRLDPSPLSDNIDGLALIPDGTDLTLAVLDLDSQLLLYPSAQAGKTPAPPISVQIPDQSISLLAGEDPTSPTLFVCSPAGVSVIDATTDQPTETETIPTPSPITRMVHSGTASNLMYGVTNAADGSGQVVAVDLNAHAQIAQVPLQFSYSSAAFEDTVGQCNAYSPDLDGIVGTSLDSLTSTVFRPTDLISWLELNNQFPAGSATLVDSVAANHGFVASAGHLLRPGQSDAIFAGYHAIGGTGSVQPTLWPDRKLSVIIRADGGFLVLFDDGYVRLGDADCMTQEGCATQWPDSFRVESYPPPNPLLSSWSTPLPTPGRDGLLASAAWAPDAKLLAVARNSTDDTPSRLMRLVPADPSQAPVDVLTQDAGLFGGPVAISRDGTVAAVVGFLKSRGSQLGTLYFVLNGDRDSVCAPVEQGLGKPALRDVRSVAVAPDGRAIYAGTALGHVYSLDIGDGASCPASSSDVIRGIDVRLILDTATSAPIWPLLITADGSEMLSLAVTPSHDMFLVQ